MRSVWRTSLPCIQRPNESRYAVLSGRVPLVFVVLCRLHVVLTRVFIIVVDFFKIFLLVCFVLQRIDDTLSRLIKSPVVNDCRVNFKCMSLKQAVWWKHLCPSRFFLFCKKKSLIFFKKKSHFKFSLQSYQKGIYYQAEIAGQTITWMAYVVFYFW